MATELRVALSTCPPAEAEALAQALVEAGVAACVNVVPAVTSVYRWEGKIQREGEALLIMKTTAGRLEALKAALLARHSYEVPEFVVLAVDAVHVPYGNWVVESTR